MKISLITAFEDMFTTPFSDGVVGQAVARKDIELDYINPRKFTKDIHHSIDDRPFGGGDGMLLSAQPLLDCLEELKSKAQSKTLSIYLTPQGKSLNQSLVKELAKEEHLILLCGRYAGVDERLVSEHIDLEISLGDFILSGAEIAAMALIDAVARLQEGVLGNAQSSVNDSFEDSLLEWPQFTRPREWQGMKVPDVLLSGDHKKIEIWKQSLRILRTAYKRPDLYRKLSIDKEQIKQAGNLFSNMSVMDRKVCGLHEKEHYLDID